jgi:hypothetical protein
MPSSTDALIHEQHIAGLFRRRLFPAFRQVVVILIGKIAVLLQVVVIVSAEFAIVLFVFFVLLCLVFVVPFQRFFVLRRVDSFVLLLVGRIVLLLVGGVVFPPAQILVFAQLLRLLSRLTRHLFRLPLGDVVRHLVCRVLGLQLGEPTHLPARDFIHLFVGHSHWSSPLPNISTVASSLPETTVMTSLSPAARFVPFAGPLGFFRSLTTF